MRRELLILDEIVEAGERAVAIVRGRSVEELRGDLNARDALLWNMTVIGEATNQLPDSLRDAHPDVPWRQPIALRNRIVHGYWGIDLEVVHTAALVGTAGLRASGPRGPPRGGSRRGLSPAESFSV